MYYVFTKYCLPAQKEIMISLNMYKIVEFSIL